MITETPTSTPPTPPQISPILEDAWTRYGKYDKNAVIAQKRFTKERKLILGLGVAATTLAVVYTVLSTLNPANIEAAWLAAPLTALTANPLWDAFMKVFRFFVVAVPIVAGGLAAYTTKFNQGINWIVLRTSAETLKKEIYRYRTQVDEFSPEQTQTETRDMKLAHHMKLISRRMMETQVNQTGLEPYRDKLPPKYGTAEGDDGFSDLTAEQYLAWRVDDQFNYYQKKAVRLGKESQRFQLIIVMLGAIGSLLAAFELEVWVAVSGAMVTAFTSYLEFRRVESTLVACNRGAADLYDIRTWWRSLPESAKALRANLETLVGSTEAVIESENASWIQEMRDALADAYKTKEDDRKKQEGSAEDEAGTEDDSPSDSIPAIGSAILADTFLTGVPASPALTDAGSTSDNGASLPPADPSADSPPGELSIAETPVEGAIDVAAIDFSAPSSELLAADGANGATVDAVSAEFSGGPLAMDGASAATVDAVSPECSGDPSGNGAIAPEPLAPEATAESDTPDTVDSANGTATTDSAMLEPALSDEPIDSMPTDQWIEVPPVDQPTEATQAVDQPADEPQAQPETQPDETVTEPQENEPSVSASI